MKGLYEGLHVYKGTIVLVQPFICFLIQKLIIPWIGIKSNYWDTTEHSVLHHHHWKNKVIITRHWDLGLFRYRKHKKSSEKKRNNIKTTPRKLLFFNTNSLKWTTFEPTLFSITGPKHENNNIFLISENHNEKYRRQVNFRRITMKVV